MARLLTLLLLYHADFHVGRYFSLEGLIERQREGYYESLYQSSQNRHETEQTLLPWWEYFLGVMLLGAYREFEERVSSLTGSKGAKTAMILDVIGHMSGESSVGDIKEKCPHVGVDLIRRILRHERVAGGIECLGRGPEARWKRV